MVLYNCCWPAVWRIGIRILPHSLTGPCWRGSLFHCAASRSPRPRLFLDFCGAQRRFLSGWVVSAMVHGPVCGLQPVRGAVLSSYMIASPRVSGPSGAAVANFGWLGSFGHDVLVSGGPGLPQCVPRVPCAVRLVGCCGHWVPPCCSRACVPFRGCRPRALAGPTHSGDLHSPTTPRPPRWGSVLGPVGRSGPRDRSCAWRAQ